MSSDVNEEGILPSRRLRQFMLDSTWRRRSTLGSNKSESILSGAAAASQDVRRSMVVGDTKEAAPVRKGGDSVATVDLIASNLMNRRSWLPSLERKWVLTDKREDIQTGWCSFNRAASTYDNFQSEIFCLKSPPTNKAEPTADASSSDDDQTSSEQRARTSTIYPVFVHDQKKPGLSTVDVQWKQQQEFYRNQALPKREKHPHVPTAEVKRAATTTETVSPPHPLLTDDGREIPVERIVLDDEKYTGPGGSSCCLPPSKCTQLFSCYAREVPGSQVEVNTRPLVDTQVIRTPVEKIVEIPEYEFKYVDKVVDVPVKIPKVIINRIPRQEKVKRFIPVPMVEIFHEEIQVPQWEPRVVKVDLPIYVGGYPGCPLSARLCHKGGGGGGGHESDSRPPHNTPAAAAQPSRRSTKDMVLDCLLRSKCCSE